MLDEPRRHPVFMACLAWVILGTVPLPFIGAEPALIFGLPTWLVWSLGFTIAMAALTSWGLLRLWQVDDEIDPPVDEEREAP